MNAESVLVASEDIELRAELIEVLEQGGGFSVTAVGDFGAALDEILHRTYAFLLVEVDLPDISGLDLLAVANTLKPPLPAIVIDRELVGKSAMAAFRLGALDYICKPVNLEFVLLRIQRELAAKRQQQTSTSPAPLRNRQRSQDRERWINPTTRPAALLLKRPQYVRIEHALAELQGQVNASFVGLIDGDHNVISGVGEMAQLDLLALRRVLSADYGSSKLADLLKEKTFSHIHLEGDHNSVFIVGFGSLHPVSLVAICPVDARPGTVWLWCKRAANTVSEILTSAEAQIRTTQVVPVAALDG